MELTQIKKMIYAFRFGSSDKGVHLTEQEIDLIPYLSVLVAHKDDFSSIHNENGEYVLIDPIEYTWFLAILRCVTSKNPYILFNELSENDNILDTLQLVDYLGINSFPLPLLKDEDLLRSNSTDNKDKTKRIEHHKANLSEARQTAAEFVIALGKNECNLRDLHTVNRIFSLIWVILSDAAVFSSRFRHHTVTVVKECCSSFFSKRQQHLIPTVQQIAQYSKIDVFTYLYDDDKPISYRFPNAFAWRGISIPMPDMHINSSSETSKKESISTSPFAEEIFDLRSVRPLQPSSHPIIFMDSEESFSFLWRQLWKEFFDAIENLYMIHFMTQIYPSMNSDEIEEIMKSN